MMTPPSDARRFVRSYRPGDEAGILGVAQASVAFDQFPGISREDAVHLVERLAGDPGGTVAAVEDGEIVGYCTPRSDMLTVHPGRRRRGHGRRLALAALDIVRSQGLQDLILYAPLDHPAATGFLEALGFRYHSSLWRFELARSVEVEGPAFPSEFTIRPYADGDLDAFVELANASFIDHPTPISFPRTAVAHVHDLPDFDPGHILLVTPRGADDQLVAWTKTEPKVGEDGVRGGTIALIGVLRAWRGRGLGRELLRWGIDRLRAAGAETIDLAVEAANDRALGLYRRTGFEPTIEWPHYSLSVAGAGPSRASAPE
jgi:mycothiol synthase